MVSWCSVKTESIEYDRIPFFINMTSSIKHSPNKKRKNKNGSIKLTNARLGDAVVDKIAFQAFVWPTLLCSVRLSLSLHTFLPLCQSLMWALGPLGLVPGGSTTSTCSLFFSSLSTRKLQFHHPRPTPCGQITLMLGPGPGQTSTARPSRASNRVGLGPAVAPSPP